MPIGRPMAMTEPNASSRMTTAASSPTSSPMPVAGSSNAKNRSPPISIRSGEPAPARTANAFRFSRSPLSSSSSAGYWTRTSATRPSGEIAGSLVPSTFGRPATAARTSARAARASAESRNVARSSSGVRTTWAVRPAWSERAAVSRSAASWESRPGTAKESSSRWPKAPEAPTTSTETISHDPITVQGRRAANRPHRYSADDSMVLLLPEIRWWLGVRDPGDISVTRRGHGHIGR